jgi:hypothetical protein
LSPSGAVVSFGSRHPARVIILHGHFQARRKGKNFIDFDGHFRLHPPGSHHLILIRTPWPGAGSFSLSEFARDSPNLAQIVFSTLISSACLAIILAV